MFCSGDVHISKHVYSDVQKAEDIMVNMVQQQRAPTYWYSSSISVCPIQSAAQLEDMARWDTYGTHAMRGYWCRFVCGYWTTQREMFDSAVERNRLMEELRICSVLTTCCKYFPAELSDSEAELHENPNKVYSLARAASLGSTCYGPWPVQNTEF